MNFTGYPSIDNIHNKDYSFFDRNPIIPDMSIYNTINMLSTFYRKEEAIDCLDLNVNYDEMINDTVLLSKTLVLRRVILYRYLCLIFIMV